MGTQNKIVKSWTFILQIFSSKTQKFENHDSPLRIESKEAAIAFGEKMFEPPLTVNKWSIVGSMEAPNFPFKK